MRAVPFRETARAWVYYGLRELFRVNTDLLLILAVMLEFDFAVDERVEGVVLTNAHVLARTDSGSALTNDDVARNDSLPVRFLHAEALGLAVAAVLRGTNALLMGEELQTDLHHGLIFSFLWWSWDHSPQGRSSTETLR